MLCLGQSFTDYDDMMRIGEELVREVVHTVRGRESLTFLGVDVDLSRPWRRLTVAEALDEYADVDVTKSFELAYAEQAVLYRGLALPDSPYAAQRG